MKTAKSLLFVTLVAASTALVSASPRGDANQTIVGSGSTPDVTRPSLSASPRSEANKTRVVAGSEQADTVAAIRNSKLSPRAQSQASSSDFQVAPLAGKSCCSGCCKK